MKFTKPEIQDIHDDFMEMRDKLSKIISPVIQDTQKKFEEEPHYLANMVSIGIDIACYYMSMCIELGMVEEKKALDTAIKDLKSTLPQYLEVLRNHRKGSMQ